jgi:GNAT superfamily N-acetyltransferase
MRKRGETQPGVHAEAMPGSAFKIVGDPVNKEAAVFTSTARERPVGWLSHDPVRETIDTVYVHPDFRGKGLGPRMRQAAGNPAHSDRLTTAGERFARRSGGAVPKKISRQEPLHEAGHQQMLPDFANWIKESPTARRVQ